MHAGQRLVGFGAGAEEDRLLDLGGAGEALERLVGRPRAQHRAGVGERLERADQQRPLAVEQADRALAVDHAGDRAAGREVVVGVFAAVATVPKATAARRLRWKAWPAPARALPSWRPLAQLVRGEDLVEVLAGERLALERVGGEVVEAVAVGGEQRAGAAVGVARELIAATSTSRRVRSESA